MLLLIHHILCRNQSIESVQNSLEDKEIRNMFCARGLAYQYSAMLKQNLHAFQLCLATTDNTSVRPPNSQCFIFTLFSVVGRHLAYPFYVVSRQYHSAICIHSLPMSNLLSPPPPLLPLFLCHPATVRTIYN